MLKFCFNLCLLLLVVNGTGAVSKSSDQHPLAFPSAEGWGKYSWGGRGGRIIKVTNLLDHGPGSLREAVEQTGARIVIFEVSGNIALKTPLHIINDSITIAGQSAPGDGICLKDCPLSISASNVIIRYIRVRLGDKYSHDYDALTGGKYGQHDVIIDHVSTSWSIDECFSLYKISNLTVQWCLISHSLSKSHHTKGAHGFGGIWGGYNATWHHNLMANNSSRNPRFSSVENTKNIDYRNNMVWNYGYKAAYGGGRYGEINFVGNYYKPGPASTYPHLLDVADDGTGLYYVEGNFVEGCDAINSDNSRGVGGKNVTECLVGHPFEFMPINEHLVENLPSVILEQVGCSHRRDSYDQAVIHEVMTGKTTFGVNGIVNSQQDVGGWPELKQRYILPDSDNDGIPDFWEEARGLNINVPDANLYSLSTDYTNIEMYLNHLVE